jgi:two-component system, cell cycle sensor histidine kinase and response regulator CckA
MPAFQPRTSAASVIDAGDEPRIELVRARSVGFESLPRGNERILLVEDDSLLRRSTSAILSGLGYRVTACGDGAQAMAMAADDDLAIDLLLTDFAMPGMNGCELAKRMQVARPGTRMLLTSGWPEEVIRRGTDRELSFIAKPFTMSELAHKVREVLGR